MAVTRRKGNIISGGLRHAEYRTPSRVAWAKSTAALRGDKTPFGLHDWHKGADGKWRERWKDAPAPKSFEALNADVTGFIRGHNPANGLYSNPNTYIDNASERGMDMSHLRNRMRERFARSAGVYRQLGMNPLPHQDRTADQVAGLVESGLFKPGERIGYGPGAMIGHKARTRDYDTGHRGLYNIQAAIDAENARIHAMQDAEGLTRNELPTSREFWQEFVKPTIGQREEWDRRLAADDGEGRKTNPWASAPLSFEEWLQYARGANERVPETLAALNPGGDYYHIGRYRPGHEDDPAPMEALRRLGLLPGMTPTREGRRLAQIVTAGQGRMM